MPTPTPTLNARILTRTDYDFNWAQSSLVLQPGELAISIPTRDAEAGDTVIPGTGEIGSGAKTEDTSKDLTIKIGNNDTFISGGKVSGTHGILTTLVPAASSNAINTEVEFRKNTTTGNTDVILRQASASYDPQTGEILTTQSGILTASDYKDMRTAMDFMRDPSVGQVTHESIRDAVTAGVITDVTIQKDASTGELGVSGNIIWNCQGALQN